MLSGKVTFDVEPVWAEIDNVRESCADFLRRQAVDNDTNTALTMVACELAENATKYGAFAGGHSKMSIAVTVNPQNIIIEVRNPVTGADDAHLARLDRTVQWIRGYQDPFEVYLERLREVSGQTLDSTESGLGLVRIAYEGQSILDFYVNEQNILAVSAMFRLS